MMTWVETFGKRYLKLFALVEGPELEPTLFHSHFLSSKAIKAAGKRVRPLLNGDVLDVGAGTGYGKTFLPENANYFPTDIGGARDYHDNSLTRKGVPLVKQCSVYDIDYPANRFDSCLALNLFEHLKEPTKAISEIKRVVKNNGAIALLVPFNFPVHGYPDDYWRWTVEGLRHFLEAEGVRVTACFSCGKTIHSIALNLNLFLREGIILKGHKVSTPRVFVYAVVRPILTLLFFVVNIVALIAGILDRSSTLPIAICAVGWNIKH